MQNIKNTLPLGDICFVLVYLKYIKFVYVSGAILGFMKV